MPDLSALMHPAAPWLLRSLTAYDVLIGDLQTQLAEGTASGLYLLDAKAMRTLDQAYDHLNQVFNFPAYFGRNLNALNDCLTDLEWRDAKVFVVVIRRCKYLLCEETAEKLDGLLDTFRFVGQIWSQPISRNEPWDRPPIPFHTIVHFDNTDDLEAGEIWGRVPEL